MTSCPSGNLARIRGSRPCGRTAVDYLVPGGIMTLSTSHWPADFSQPVADVTVGDALRGAAAEAPRATALVEGAVDPAARRRWSYAELLEASERAARALLGRFAAGDRVAVWATNIPEWVILELAAGLAGSSRKRRRARSRNSCCARPASPMGPMSRYWPRAPT